MQKKRHTHTQDIHTRPLMGELHTGIIYCPLPIQRLRELCYPRKKYRQDQGMVSCVFPYQYPSPPPPPLPLPFPGGGGQKILEKIACLSSGCAPAARLLIWSCHCKTWERRQDMMRTDYSVLTYRVSQGSLSLGFSVPRPRDGCERCLSRIPWYVCTYTRTHTQNSGEAILATMVTM